VKVVSVCSPVTVGAFVVMRTSVAAHVG